MPLNVLEDTIKYKFNDLAILKTALTHSSYSNEHKSENCKCNERLEFLGDSVLSIIVSKYLFKKYDKRPEGELTKIRASVVCTRTLSKLADKIKLGDYLCLGKGEEETGRTNVKILENAFEALLAAIFIDSENSIDTVSKFLLPLIVPEIEVASKDVIGHDYKTTLQQFIQSQGTDRIQYVCINESGPDHAKTFEVVAKLNSNVIGCGIGKTKREAEQNAAKEALDLFDVK
ncbi:MAG: ribonuclease III [Clostridia bacterium]|nr:ribonuclease III [Clostridia bacterium]